MHAVPGAWLVACRGAHGASWGVMQPVLHTPDHIKPGVNKSRLVAQACFQPHEAIDAPTISLLMHPHCITALRLRWGRHSPAAEAPVPSHPHLPARGSGACRSAPAPPAAPVPGEPAAPRSHPGEPAACTAARRWWHCSAALQREQGGSGLSPSSHLLCTDPGLKTGLLCTPVPPPCWR